MKLEFDYTLEDLKEAYAAYQPKPPARGKTAARTMGVAFVGVISFLTFTLLVWDTDSPPARPILLDIAMPFVALMLFVTPWLTYRSLKVSGVRGIWRNCGLLGAVGWLVAVGLLVLSWRFLSTATAPDARPETVTGPEGLPWRMILDFLIPHITWMLLLVTVFVLLVRQTSQQLLATWNGSPTLHRRHTLTMDGDGLTLADPLARLEAKWLAFDRVIETQNLFVLYVSEHAFHMIPKRAFADAAQLDVFRAAIDDRITHRPAAFPVMPVAG